MDITVQELTKDKATWMEGKVLKGNVIIEVLKGVISSSVEIRGLKKQMVIWEKQ